MKLIYSALLFFFVLHAAAAPPLKLLAERGQPVTISPERPERGQKVTITYDPAAKGALLPASAEEVTLVFTYSNIYEIPYKLNLEKSGSVWKTSFILPRYAVYATFYFQSGTLIDKPTPTRHYELAIYDKGKLVESSLLYKGYSLPAQQGKSDSVAIRQAALFEEELAIHPDNYEAKVRLLKYKLSKTPAAGKPAVMAEANRLIESKWMENPTQMGTINKATMGFLIMGENSRVDSIYAVVAKRYPHSGSAKDIISSSANKLKDEKKRVAILEELLKDEHEKGKDREDYRQIHKDLFTYYAAAKNRQKALYHADLATSGDTSPYLAKNYKEIAEKLSDNGFPPDDVLRYAMFSAGIADKYPVGLIRYFPEYGYIPSYVDPAVKKKEIDAVKSELVSLIALNSLHKGNTADADQAIIEALGYSDDPKTFKNIALVHEQRNRPKEAYELYWKMMMNDPLNAEAVESVRRTYKAFNTSEDELNARLKEVESVRKAAMTKELEAKRLNLKVPEFLSVVDLDGKPVDIASLKNKVVVMDFWATWCVPCIEEFPYLQKVYAKFKDNPDVVFMVVNSGSRNTLKDAKTWVSLHPEVTFPVYYNGDPKLGDKVGFDLIPTLIVLDKTGKMQFRTIGFEGGIVETKLALAIELMLK